MINELLDPISRIASTEIYINGKAIDKKAVNEYVENLEIEVNYFRHSIIGVFVCDEEFFTLSIGKSPNALTEDDTIKIILEDKSGSKFDRRFNIVKTLKTQTQKTNKTQQWNVYIEDTYGHALNSPNFTRFLTQAGFTGTPFEICQKALKTLFLKPTEISILYGDKSLNYNIKRNNLDFVSDDNPTLEYRFSKDLTPIENILKLANKYNIHLYQDFDTFHIIQNPTFENAEHIEDISKTSLFKELCDGKKYPYKICDKIKQQSSLSANDKANYKISLNLGGKKQVIKELNFNDIIKVIDINNNSDEYKDIRCENTIEVSNSYSLISSMLNDAFKKYLKASNMIIYTRPTLPYCIPGTLTTIDLATKSDFANTRMKGDYRFSGIWLIRSTTLKVLNNQFLIGRMVLCRFDNQTDATNEEEPDVITTDENEEILTNKPQKPKNIQDLKEYYDTNETKESSIESLKMNLDKIKDSSQTLSQLRSISNQLPMIKSGIKNGGDGLEDFMNTLENMKDLCSKIQPELEIILPAESQSNVTDAIKETLETLYKKIKPVADAIQNSINSIKEYVNDLISKFSEIGESITNCTNDNKEVTSRIINNIRKYKSEIYSYILKIENLILSEIKKFVNDIVSYIRKIVDTLSYNIYKSIMDTIMDSELKESVNMSMINSLLKMAIKPLIVDTMESLIQDKVYAPFNGIVSKINQIKSTINGIVNSVMAPFNSIERTVSESIQLLETNKNTPERILNMVQQQGPNIIRQSPKVIIENTGSSIKRDIETLKKKREQILKGLR